MLQSANHLTSELRTADNLLRQRKPLQAIAICQKLAAAYPKAVEPHLLLARSAQMQNRFTGMLEEAEIALRLQPDSPHAFLMEVEALVTLGRIRAAQAKISPALSATNTDPLLLARLAEMQTQMGDHAGALSTLLLAEGQFSGVQKSNPGFVYNLASAHIAVGNLTDAEALLDQLIASHPHDYDAYYNRATLRKQTPENNHVEALKAALTSGPRHVMGEVQLRYALAKELEDLGEHKESFEHLTKGAELRRNNMAYNVDDDIETMRIIQGVFESGFAGRSISGHESVKPIFVVGLPRSGTTLVDRILCSHPAISSAGEINDLPVTITHMCGPVRSKTELVGASSKLDFARLGRVYTAGLAERMTSAHDSALERIIDKTPLNFLYVGLIAKALPNATIIHVRRSDMDVGYAMLKTLFRMGYPFSYSQKDIALYIAAKNKLMSHWEHIFPGRIHTVNYEDLISDQERESRNLIAATGLPWDPNCLNFHENKSASATASAAQVRQPIYSSSVAKWQRYETELQPMYNALQSLEV